MAAGERRGRRQQLHAAVGDGALGQHRFRAARRGARARLASWTWRTTLGIRSYLPEVCAITLGSVAVNPLEMTNAYATLADRGRPVPREPAAAGPIARRADRRRGRPEGAARASTRTSPTSSRTRCRTSSTTGRGRRADIDWPAAGKTGTAQDNVDAWFCGYTVQIAACVWVGYPQGQIPLENVEGVPLVFGGTIPAAIWHDFMEVAMAGQGTRSRSRRRPSTSRP